MKYRLPDNHRRSPGTDRERPACLIGSFFAAGSAAPAGPCSLIAPTLTSLPFSGPQPWEEGITSLISAIKATVFREGRQHSVIECRETFEPRNVLVQFVVLSQYLQ